MKFVLIALTALMSIPVFAADYPKSVTCTLKSEETKETDLTLKFSPDDENDTGEKNDRNTEISFSGWGYASASDISKNGEIDSAYLSLVAEDVATSEDWLQVSTTLFRGGNFEARGEFKGKTYVLFCQAL